MVANLRVCAHCGYHFPVTARERIVQLVDEGSWSEIARDLHSADPLEFVDTQPYPERLDEAERSDRPGATRCWSAQAAIGEPAGRAGRDGLHLPGRQHGIGRGREVLRGPELAVERRMPLVSVAASGGARMQEGVLALMQMAKTVAAVDELREAGRPVRLGAGPSDHRRRRRQLRRAGRRDRSPSRARCSRSRARGSCSRPPRENVPDDFGLAESNYRHGHVDLIVPRPELRDTVARVVALLAGGTPYRRTPLIPDLGAQRAVGRLLGGARRRIRRHDPGS